MFTNIDMMKVIANNIKKFNAPYIIDQVMVAMRRVQLHAEHHQEFMRYDLLPQTSVVTHNIHEAENITGEKITDEEDMKEAAEQIVTKHGAQSALVKGGHLQGDAVDFLYDGNKIHTFSARRVDTKNTHGTGC